MTGSGCSFDGNWRWYSGRVSRWNSRLCFDLGGLVAGELTRSALVRTLLQVEATSKIVVGPIIVAVVCAVLTAAFEATCVASRAEQTYAIAT